MATETLRIVISVNGDRIARKRIEGVGRAAKKTESSVDMLKRSLQALGGAFVIREIGGMLDSMTNIRNRVTLFTEDANQATLVLEKLAGVANETRTSFEATAKVYSRMAIATADLGKSQSELIHFQGLLNKATIISGARTQEANAAMIQLSQGLAAGALRGDELRSVLEQLPYVASIIAEGMGITRGELKRLGEQGLLTSEAIFESFNRLENDINQKFAKTVPTMAQSWEIFKNNVLLFLDDLNQSIGITDKVSQALKYLGENLETIARILAVIAFRKTVAFSVGLIKKATAAVIMFGRALLLTPIGIIATAIGTLTVFADKINMAKDEFISLKNVAIEFGRKFNERVIGPIKEVFSELASEAEEFFAAFRAGIEAVFGQIEFSVPGLIRGVLRAVDMAVKGILQLAVMIGETILYLFDLVIKKTKEVAKSTWDTIGQGTKALARNLPGGEAFFGKAKDFGDVVQEAPYTQKKEEIRLPEDVKKNFIAAGKLFGRTLHENLVHEFYKEAESSSMYGNFGEVVGQKILQGTDAPMESLSFRLNKRMEEINEIVGDGLEGMFEDSLSSAEADTWNFWNKMLEEMKLRWANEKKTGKLPPDKDALKRAKKWKEYISDLRQSVYDLESAMNPLLAAEREEAAVSFMLAEALTFAGVSRKRVQKIIEDYKKANQDDLDPVGAELRKLDEELIMLKLTNQEREREIRLRTIQKALAEKGLELELAGVEAQYGDRVDAIIAEIKAKEESMRLDALKESAVQMVLGAEQAYADAVIGLGEAHKEGTLNFEQYTKGMGLAAEQYREASAETEGMAGYLNELNKQVSDFDAGEVMARQFVSFGDQFIDTVVEMEFSFKKLIDSMIKNMMKLFLKQVFYRSVLAMLGAPSVPLPSVWGGNNQYGGSFRVPNTGTSGPDSEVVAFRASPGEQVTVTPPGQTSNRESEGTASDVNLRVINVSDPTEAIEAMGTPAGERMVVNAVRKNARVIRRMLR